MLSTALFIGATLSCGHITVFDREFCGDLGPEGAHCAHTLINKKRDIAKAQWDKERIGMLCTSSQAFTDGETAIDQFCTAYNICDFETRESLRRAFVRIHGVQKRAHKAAMEYME